MNHICNVGNAIECGFLAVSLSHLFCLSVCLSLSLHLFSSLSLHSSLTQCMSVSFHLSLCLPIFSLSLSLTQNAHPLKVIILVHHRSALHLARINFFRIRMKMFLVVLQCLDGAVTFGTRFATKRFRLAFQLLMSVLV